MSIKYLFVSLLFISSLFFMSCDADEPKPPVEPEVITTLTYTLTPSGMGNPVTLSFQDLDGDGGTPPTITAGTLTANQSYTGVLELLNESESPAENITDEIRSEDEAHQFFFSTTVSDLFVNYSDQDQNDNPVGLATSLTTGDPATGIFTIVLRHEPDKSATGVADGDLTNAGGETDIEVSFQIRVE